MNATLPARAAHCFLIIAGVLLLLPACQKDDGDTSLSPTIVFSSDSGYVFLDDTVGMEDTLLVGVTITGGDDKINTFKVLANFDGVGDMTVDSLPVSSSPFQFEKTIITRGVPGTEKWTFWIQERDGDIYRRSLTFLVE
ncbi:MAG TPA: hypothetical protein PLB89_08665 [Flavobacteriales bacterium]|nr:hypothetical protein [Flavobacteriales bacterium]